MKGISNITSRRKPEKRVTKFVGVVFALILAAFTLPISAWAGDVSHFRSTGAHALFFSSNPPGCNCSDNPECIFTGLLLDASSQSIQNPPGSGKSSSEAFIPFISQFDCDGNRLLSADCCAGGAFCPVELADQDFQVSTKLDSATLNATFKCFDSVSGLSFNVDVDLNWAGTGGLSRGNGSNHSKTPGCTDNVHFNFTQRDAQASGSVFDGTTNFTPDPSEFANLTAVKTGRVAIGCQ